MADRDGGALDHGLVWRCNAEGHIRVVDVLFLERRQLRASQVGFLADSEVPEDHAPSVHEFRVVLGAELLLVAVLMVQDRVRPVLVCFAQLPAVGG